MAPDHLARQYLWSSAPKALLPKLRLEVWMSGSKKVNIWSSWQVFPPSSCAHTVLNHSGMFQTSSSLSIILSSSFLHCSSERQSSVENSWRVGETKKGKMHKKGKKEQILSCHPWPWVLGKVKRNRGVLCCQNQCSFFWCELRQKGAPAPDPYPRQEGVGPEASPFAQQTRGQQLPLVSEVASDGCDLLGEPTQQVHWLFSLGAGAMRTGVDSSGRLPGAPSPYKGRLWRAISSLAISTKTSSMFLDSLADVSRTARRPYFSARMQASSKRTWRFSHRSHLFPGSEREADILGSNLLWFFKRWT